MSGIAPTAYKASPCEEIKETIEYYDALSRGYDELYGEEQERKYAVGLKMLKPSWRVLDVGCGTALLLDELRGTIYIGLDVSPGMLKVASKRKEGRAADLVLGEASMLPFRSRAFPSCYSFTVLQNVPLKERALKELRRVCKGAVVSSLRGKGLEEGECEEVYPDVVCLIVQE